MTTTERITDFNKHSVADLRDRGAELGIGFEEGATRRMMAEAINETIDLREQAQTNDDAQDGAQDAATPGDVQDDTEKPFDPVTFWLAGPEPLYPNPRIRVPGDRYPVHFRHGFATVTTQEEYDTVKRALGDDAYEEDMQKSRKVKPCPTCGYAPRSTEAREAHEDCHPPAH